MEHKFKSGDLVYVVQSASYFPGSFVALKDPFEIDCPDPEYDEHYYIKDWGWDDCVFPTYESAKKYASKINKVLEAGDSDEHVEI